MCNNITVSACKPLTPVRAHQRSTPLWHLTTTVPSLFSCANSLDWYVVLPWRLCIVAAPEMWTFKQRSA